MKIRTGFVSNSSSTSFVLKIWKNVKTFEDFLKHVMLVWEDDWSSLYPKRRSDTFPSYEYNMIRIYEQIWSDVQNHMVSMEEAKEFLKEWSGNCRHDNFYELQDKIKRILKEDKESDPDYKINDKFIDVFDRACAEEVEEDSEGFFDEEHYNYAIIGYEDNSGWWGSLLEHGPHWDIPVEMGTVQVISHH